MILISPASIQKADSWLNSLEEAQIDEVVHKFSQKQGGLLNYLLSAGMELDHQEDREQLLHLGIIIWLAFESEIEHLPPVEEDQVRELEAAHLEAVGSLNGSESEMVSQARSLLDRFAQPELLEYLRQSLLGRDSSEQDQASEADFLKFLVLLVVAESFHNRVNKPQMRIVE